MNIYQEAENFIRELYPNDNINDSKSTGGKNLGRLTEAIRIIEKYDRPDPNTPEFANFLKMELRGKKQGEEVGKDKFDRTLSIAQKFYQKLKSKGDFSMNDNEAITSEEQTAFNPEFAGFAETMRLKQAIHEWEAEETKGSNQPNDNEAMSSKESPKRERGKPLTSGRSEKITLYVTPQTFNRIDDLRKYDEANLQDLLNEAIEVYFKSREDDMRFLQEQEEARRARKAKRAS